MTTLTVTPDGAGRRLDKWLLKSFPSLPMSMMQKSLRTGKIKLNGHKATGDTRLAEGDVIELFIDDALTRRPERQTDPFLSRFRWRLDIVYEDGNFIIVDKKPGLMVHPDRTEQVNTLITHIQAYLYQKGEWDSKDKQQFPPALCNRIDRFTGGLVIAAKNEAALKLMNQKIANREVKKEYLCIILGSMYPPSGVMDTYILKPEGSRKVQVSRNPLPGGQRAVTGYQTIDTRDGLSLVNCDLQTGRTHQIRAQFAWFGHPLLGDRQYGDHREGERFGRDYQALYAWALRFDFDDDGGILSPIAGRRFTARNVPFVRTYFPDRVI